MPQHNDPSLPDDPLFEPSPSEPDPGPLEPEEDAEPLSHDPPNEPPEVDEDQPQPFDELPGRPANEPPEVDEEPPLEDVARQFGIEAAPFMPGEPPQGEPAPAMPGEPPRFEPAPASPRSQARRPPSAISFAPVAPPLTGWPGLPEDAASTGAGDTAPDLAEGLRAPPGSGPSAFPTPQGDLAGPGGGTDLPELIREQTRLLIELRNTMEQQLMTLLNIQNNGVRILG